MILFLINFFIFIICFSILLIFLIDFKIDKNSSHVIVLFFIIVCCIISSSYLIIVLNFISIFFLNILISIIP